MTIRDARGTDHRSTSRRSLAKGAAWSVPALLAVPAAAVAVVSTRPNAQLLSTSGCKPKVKGDQSKDYWLKACFVNNDIHSLTITGPTTLTLNGTDVLAGSTSPASAVLAPGGTQCFVVHVTSTNSAEGSLAGSFLVHDNGTNTDVSVPVSVAKADVGTDCTGVTGCKDGACP